MKKPSIKSLEKKLWELVKEKVFERDKNRCQRCGKMVSGQSRHPSHVIPKSRCKYLRYDPMNIKTLCFHHHRWWHLNPLEASQWFQGAFPERYQYLMENRAKTINEERRKQGLTLREWYERKIGKYEKDTD